MKDGPTKTPEELLESVHDHDTFMAFVWALVADREKAEQLERADPKRYQFGGAGNWQNSSISAFLGAAASYFEDSGWGSGSAQPSWRDLAQFLYLGKIYE
jgi:hypothetical protein